MSNYNDINNLITSFSGHKNVISFPVIYLDIAEDMNTAALLNQMVFWSDKSKRRDGFFYKTYLEWTEEIRLSEYQLRRSVKKLRDLGFIETKVKRANGSPTTHYKVNMDKISESILKELQFRNQTNSSLQTEESEETLTDDYTDDYNIDKEYSLDLNKKAVKKKPKKETVKHKYGEFENVLLSDDEHKKLLERYPKDLNQRIERLSGYVASTGKKYKDHYATIINWAKKDKPDDNRSVNVLEKLKELE